MFELFEPCFWLTEFMQQSLGAQTYQLAKKYVDKVITVRYNVLLK